MVLHRNTRILYMYSRFGAGWKQVLAVHSAGLDVFLAALYRLVQGETYEFT